MKVQKELEFYWKVIKVNFLTKKQLVIGAFLLGLLIGYAIKPNTTLLQIAREQEHKDKYLSSILYTTHWCINNGETRELCLWTQQWTTNRLQTLKLK